MEWIFGILMFRCHVCLTYFFDNAFLGSKPEVFLHVFQLGRTPSVSTGPLPKSVKTNSSQLNCEFHLNKQRKGPGFVFLKYHKLVSCWTAKSLRWAGSRPQIRWAEPSTMARCSPDALDHCDPTVPCLPAQPCLIPHFSWTTASPGARLSELKTVSFSEIWP